ncbi:putative allantoate permease [Xylogone sp. PMI_703]|nr:putative allantoate permease [Xylogone sp. PMI_703]
MKNSVTTGISQYRESEEEKALQDLLPNKDEDSRILRKIDWRIVPIMFMAYFLQFLDKVIVNYANVMGLQKDLHMTGNDFTWLATAFFIAFCIAEIPQGYLLQKFSIPRVLGLNILCWGITICCSAAVKDYASLLALRVLLGCFEASISPCLVLTTAMWYTKRQSGPRYGIWYSGLGAGQLFGGLISFAVQHGSMSKGFSSWRIMMVVVGAVNIVMALVILTFLPSSVESAKFLTAEEKAVIYHKLAIDQAGNGPQVFRYSEIVDAFTDLQMWLLLLLTILVVIPSGVITTFSSTLILGFGYTPKQAALLNMPSGVVSITATLITTFAILRNFPRWLGIVLTMIPGIMSGALMSFESSRPGKLAGIYLINCCVAGMALIFSWVGANTAGYTKRVAANAVVAVGFGVANIIGPQTFQAKNAPKYLPATVTVLVVFSAATINATLLRILYGYRNSRTAAKRALQLSEIAASGVIVMGVDDDKTDRTNAAFIYAY